MLGGGLGIPAHHRARYVMVGDSVSGRGRLLDLLFLLFVLDLSVRLCLCLRGHEEMRLRMKKMRKYKT